MIRKRFAKYLRKSREEKDLPTDIVLQSHNRILDEVCMRMDIHVDEEDVFKELVSAESIDARPEMKRLLKLVEQGYYDGVLVYEVQRLCRGNGMDQALVNETFKLSGTKIITPNKVYDTANNESDEEYLEFGLFMSRREYKTINRRLKDGKISAFKMGKFINSVAPTGYKRIKLKGDKGYTLEIDETEAPVIREMFDLKSANFETEFKDKTLTFTVYGYGHGVGMSQNGANYMAKQGFNFKEILTHYYTDCKVKKIK